MKTPRLPQTDSIQELAHFWDTRDLTDFEDELEEVTEPVFEPASAQSKHQTKQEVVERVLGRDSSSCK